MIDEKVYELLCCQLGLANEEKAGLRKQVNELIARLKAIEESNKENSKVLVDTINKLSATAENNRKEMVVMRKQLEAKDEVNMRPVRYLVSGFSLRTTGNTVSAVPPSKEGCTLCRRVWIDALSSDRTAMNIIDSIGDKFRNEDLFRMIKLSSKQIK